MLYVGADGTRVEATTGANGEAALAGLPGGQRHALRLQERIPARRGADHASTAKATGPRPSRSQTGGVATSELKSKELNLKEIEEARHRPERPGQPERVRIRDQARVRRRTSRVELHGYVNCGGEFVGSFGAGGGGGGWSCSATGCEGSGGDGGRIVAVPEVVEGHPLIQWLILRGKAAVLKQFFEVDMVVQNLSPEPGTVSRSPQRARRRSTCRAA